MRLFKLDERKTTLYTRYGLFVSIGIAVILALFFRSVVDIWHVFGSVGTPALLLPVFFSFVGSRRLGVDHIERCAGPGVVYIQVPDGGRRILAGDRADIPRTGCFAGNLRVLFASGNKAFAE